MNCFVEAMKNWAAFRGRMGRGEYWCFMFFYFVFLFTPIILAEVTGNSEDPGVLQVIFGIYFFIMIIPTMSATVRRLHDTGRSGWMILVNLLPIVGGIWLLILTVAHGTTGENEYGPDPKWVT